MKFTFSGTLTVSLPFFFISKKRDRRSLNLNEIPCMIHWAVSPVRNILLGIKHNCISMQSSAFVKSWVSSTYSSWKQTSFLKFLILKRTNNTAFKHSYMNIFSTHFTLFNKVSFDCVVICFMNLILFEIRCITHILNYKNCLKFVAARERRATLGWTVCEANMHETIYVS